MYTHDLMLSIFVKITRTNLNYSSFLKNIFSNEKKDDNTETLNLSEDWEHI